MRICVSGTSSIGKTTFIKDFIKAYPMYKEPERSYRDLVVEKKLNINREGDEASQRAIRDFISDQAMATKPRDNVIFDRGILDNVIYSIYKNDKNPDSISEGFIHQSLHICRETCKFYDIIFIIPSTKYDKVEERDMRETDLAFRDEINTLFQAALKTYREARTMFFDMKDAPGVIEIFGTPEERIAMAKMYIDPKTGQLYKEEKSLLTQYF